MSFPWDFLKAQKTENKLRHFCRHAFPRITLPQNPNKLRNCPQRLCVTSSGWLSIDGIVHNIPALESQDFSRSSSTHSITCIHSLYEYFSSFAVCPGSFHRVYVV